MNKQATALKPNIGFIFILILSAALFLGVVSTLNTSNGYYHKTEKTSGKNEKHSNNKARQTAKEKYKEAKKQLETAAKETNKTPAQKKQYKQLEKKVKHLKRQIDNTGEHHSQKHKGY